MLKFIFYKVAVIAKYLTRFSLLLFCFFYCKQCYAMVDSKYLSPLSFGLLEAQSDIERYKVLLRCHEEAIVKGFGVSYDGIDTVFIEIPSDPRSIPLAEYTDFAGVVIVVHNDQKDFPVFEMKSELAFVDIEGSDIDKGNFKNIDILKNKECLLVIKDTEPWVRNRIGYNYGAIRKDVFFVKNGVSKNCPIYSYKTQASRPEGGCVPVKSTKKIVKNLRFIRSEKSNKIAFCFAIFNQYNLELKNISIITPKNDEKYGDEAIKIENCVKVYLDRVTILGTYSQIDKYGYGVNLNNVSNLEVNKMYARADWGVFGSNNVQNVLLKDCDINRFDIHCYGRDIKSVRCKYSQLYNSFASVYGKIVFKDCSFSDSYPILMPESYNAYTPFDICFSGCSFFLSKEKNSIVRFYKIPGEINTRPELKQKCLPNIKLKNSVIRLAEDVNIGYLLQLYCYDQAYPFAQINKITVKNTKLYCNSEAQFLLKSSEFNTENPLRVRMDIR